MRLKELTICIYNQIFHISGLLGGLKVEKSSRTTDTMKGTMLVAAANKKNQLLFAFWKNTTSPTAGSAVITKESQGPSVALHQFTTKSQQQYATLFLRYKQEMFKRSLVGVKSGRCSSGHHWLAIKII